MKKRYTAVLLALMMFTGAVSCSSASSPSTSDGGSNPVEATTQKEADENTDNNQDTENSDTKLFSMLCIYMVTISHIVYMIIQPQYLQNIISYISI